MINFLFLGPMGFLPVFMNISPSDPMDIQHERHRDTKSCLPSGGKVKAEIHAHINILVGIWSCRVPFLGSTLHLSRCAL